jgi:hypothetical protein
VIHETAGWYLIGAGAGMAAVGLCFWSPAAVQRSRPGRFLLGVAAIVFGHAPDSWIPWGLAFALMGAGIVAGQPAEDPLAALAVVSLVVGGVFLVRPPRWAAGRAIHVYRAELGIDKPPKTRRQRGA